MPNRPLRSLCCDSNRVIGAHSCNLHSTWNCQRWAIGNWQLCPYEMLVCQFIVRCWKSQRIGRGEKTPAPKISALLRKRPVLLRANFVLTMTAGFLYGAGAETLIFVTGTSGKKSENFRLPAEKPKSAVDTQKTKKNRRLGIRCWDPNLSGGYQNCGLGIHPWDIFQNRSGKNSQFFSKV